MSDLIHANELLEKVISLQSLDGMEIVSKHNILIAKTVDAVEVVRCKDCNLRHSSEFCECRDEMAYCSDGERATGTESEASK